jgi:acyl-CoA dehydrogenase
MNMETLALDVELSDELRAMRDAARKFTEKELPRWAQEIDRVGEIPDGAIEVLQKNGFCGMRLPVEYGGGGLSLFQYCIVLEEFARLHRAFTIAANYSSGMTPMAITRHGTPEQKDKYLRGFAAGKLKSGFALTEPEAGSDPSGMRTRAEKRGDKWIMNGRKHYISGGHVADVIMVMAVTDPVKRARGGITAFLVDKNTPGFTVTRVDTTIATDAIKLAELTFEDCELPESAVVGEVGAGFKVAMRSLNDGRLSVSCSCVGAAESLLEMATNHAKQRKTFGKLLAQRQAIQWMLADSAMEIAAGRALAYDILRRLEAGKNVGSAGSMCKLYCSEMVGRVVDRVVQIHGGMGVIRGFPVERFYRDVRHYRVGEGASEIQRIIIARDLLRGVDIDD